MEKVKKMREIDEIKESEIPRRRKRRNNYINKTAIAVASYNVSGGILLKMWRTGRCGENRRRRVISDIGKIEES